MGRHLAQPADDASSGLAAGVDDSGVGDAVGATGVDDSGTGDAVGADVRVVSGDPSPEELAAVIAVLQRQADEAAAAGRAEVTESPRSGWDASARGLRQPIGRGAGVWSRSLR